MDIDYRQFFILNGIETIIWENCLFTNYTNEKKKIRALLKKLYLIYAKKVNKCYTFDFNSINEVFFKKIKNKGVEDLTYLFRFLSIEIEGNDLSSEVIDYLKSVKTFLDNLKNTFEYLRENIK